jgi:hypothetical protein
VTVSTTCPNNALQLTAYSLRFAALRFGFRQQLKAGVRQAKQGVLSVKHFEGREAMVGCQSCGVEAPTKYVEFYQNIGALFMRFSKSIKGILCKNCINHCF